MKHFTVPSTLNLQTEIHAFHFARELLADTDDEEFIVLCSDLMKAWADREKTAENYGKSLAGLAVFLLRLADKANLDLGKEINKLMGFNEGPATVPVDLQSESIGMASQSSASLRLIESNPADFVIQDGVLVGYKGHSKSDIIIPDGVVEIGECAFFLHEEILRIIIPDTVTTIGPGAFAGCCSLADIEIPDSVVNIGGGAFFDCEMLAEADGFVVVRDVLYFYSGSKRKDIIVPEGITKISARTFWRNSDLQSIILPEGLTTIEPYAFSYCRSLTAVTLPKSLQEIGDRAFEFCDRLRRVSPLEENARIGENAFAGCLSLADAYGFVIFNHVLYSYCEDDETAVIPVGVQKIANSALSDRQELTRVIVPDSVLYIEPNAFCRCKNLAEIVLPDNQAWMLMRCTDKEIGRYDVAAEE